LAYQKFNCRLENCLGPYNVIVRDLDGTFMGNQGALVAYNPGATNGTCEEVKSFHGFRCTDLINDKSVWKMLSFESLDPNRMKVILRPF